MVPQLPQPPSPLPRTLEPEVMDTEQEARDYDAMDHAEVNARFCDDLLAMGRPLGRVLDVGTGTALIPVELCSRYAEVVVDAIDLATHMLVLAERNVARAGLANRVSIARVDAKATGWPGHQYDIVMSNSIVHHIPDPPAALAEMWRLVKPGGVLFVRDLERPANVERVGELVHKYAPIPDGSAEIRAMHERQRALFEASLHAALTVDEVRAMVASLNIPAAAVRVTSDRHWTLAHVKP
jgi:ubiquinone/menaquinone biosynthesis C-methylase UbiE